MNQNQLPLRRRPIIRVFVSSTFDDLKHERNALQKDVFLELEKFCATRQFQFQAIDLRWGVPTEVSLDNRTMQICFKELERSQEVSPQPNFLILLGNRYGWRPLPEEISVDEYKLLRSHASNPAETEILADWYRKVENAVPPVHILQSQKAKFGDMLEQQRKQEWAKVEDGLWSIINKTFSPTELAGRFKQAASIHEPLPPIVRFQASATEQEIWRGALGVSDPSGHVFACFRDIDNIADISPAEQIKGFVDVAKKSKEIDEEPKNALEELKRELRARLGESNIFVREECRQLRQLSTPAIGGN